VARLKSCPFTKQSTFWLRTPQGKQADMHILCRNCSTPLTNDLIQVPFSGRNDEMGEDFLCLGMVMQEGGSYFCATEGSHYAHIDNVIQTKPTSDTRRCNGCCGLDGCDGPNLQCNICESFVATKFTDCWRSYCVLFDPAETLVIEGTIA